MKKVVLVALLCLSLTWLFGGEYYKEYECNNELSLYGEVGGEKACKENRIEIKWPNGNLKIFEEKRKKLGWFKEETELRWLIKEGEKYKIKISTLGVRNDANGMVVFTKKGIYRWTGRYVYSSEGCAYAWKEEVGISKSDLDLYRYMEFIPFKKSLEIDTDKDLKELFLEIITRPTAPSPFSKKLEKLAKPFERLVNGKRITVIKEKPGFKIVVNDRVDNIKYFFRDFTGDGIPEYLVEVGKNGCSQYNLFLYKEEEGLKKYFDIINRL